ncbi:MAG: PHP domain-containing protein [Gemmatimonadales bacterium]
MIDLHCHSAASDGLLPPREVVRAAALAGLATIALTDHDTTAGLDEAVRAGGESGVGVIGGCEFSVRVDWGEMHLLAYFIDPGDVEIERFLVAARADRERRAREMVNRLVGLGIVISYDDVRAGAAGAAIGRPHVARAMHRLGHVASLQAAFDGYIGRGRPAFVEKELPTLRAVADLVHRRGGVVSAAHLKLRGTRTTLQRLKADGLDAVETRHPSHSPDMIANLTDAAQALDLGRSGGSDWHGERDPADTHAALGSQQVPGEWLADLDRRRPPRAME